MSSLQENGLIDKVGSLVSPDDLSTKWHPRRLYDYRYVYAVLSRRTGGISVGINLSPDKRCDYRCIYCEVDRTVPAPCLTVDLAVLESELSELLAQFRSGDVFNYSPFDVLDPADRCLKDVAFSGDGEPTAFPHFAACVDRVGALLDQFEFNAVKLVLITNATYFHKPWMREGLAALDRNHAEIWAKLDAGTQAYLHLMNGTNFPIQRLIKNIAFVGRERPITVQSMFVKIKGNAMPANQLAAYIDRLKDLTALGTEIKRVQVYTVSRPVAKSYVTPYTQAELEGVAGRISSETGLVVDAFC